MNGTTHEPAEAGPETNNSNRQRSPASLIILFQYLMTSNRAGFTKSISVRLAISGQQLVFSRPDPSEQSRPFDTQNQLAAFLSFLFR